MKNVRLNQIEKRLLSAFAEMSADRAGEVERQFLAGEISRDDFRWLIGEADPEEMPKRKSRGFYGFKNKFDGWLDARPI